MKQKGKYRIYVLGEIPRNLKERIAEIHVCGILKFRDGDGSVPKLEDKTDQATYRAAV